MRSSAQFDRHTLASKFFVVLLLTALLSMGASAATYYVATDGDNNNSGTSTGSPWRTIQKAADTVAAGDTVFIKAGNYGDENVLMKTSGTSSEAMITFEGYTATPGDNPDTDYAFGDSLNANIMPMLDGGDRATAGTAFTFNGKNYIALKNIQITGFNIGVYAYSSENCLIENVVAIELGDREASYNGKGISVGSSAYYNVISQCVVANACAEGISVSGDYNSILDCEVYCNDAESGNAAMDYYIVIGGNNNAISGCYAQRVGDLPHGGHGIQVKGDGEYNTFTDCVSDNMEIGAFGVRHRGAKYNTFTNCTALRTTAGSSSMGFMIRDGASYNTFRACRVNNVVYGVSFADSSEDDGAQWCGSYNTFENCVFDDTQSYQINFNSSMGTGTYENEFVNCAFLGGAYLFQSRTENYDNRMINCIVTDVSNFVKDTDPEDVDFDFSYSVFYGNGFATPAETGNVSGDPLLRNPDAGDFRLTAGSAAIDVSAILSLPDDYYDRPRPRGDGYDAGIHEYVDTSVFLPEAYFKLEEGSGATTDDEMGSVASGTISGAIWTTGISGNALDFDGVDDRVVFADPPALDLQGSRTVSAWVKPDAFGSYNVICAKYVWGFGLWVGSSGQLRAYIAGSSGPASSISANGAVSLDAWQHVAMTFDIDGDRKIHLYVNGEETTYSTQTAMVGSPVLNNSDFAIGSDSSARYYFSGLIDEVKVLDHALDAEQIAGESALAGDDAPVFCVRMDSGTGAVVYDGSLLGNNGSISGAGWTNGVSGKALDFDGVNDSVSFGDVLDLDGSRTVAAWIKPDQLGSYRIIFAKNMWQFGLWIDSYGRVRSFVAGSSATAQSLSSYDDTVSTGVWTHVAMAFDMDGDKKIHLYINGEEVADYATQTALAGSVVLNDSAVRIGYGGASYLFDGVIDDVKVYDKALSAEDVFSLYEAD